ncbi:hypothetical protein SRHO_G00303340 [Serrasalmus rhombeus]
MRRNVSQPSPQDAHWYSVLAHSTTEPGSKTLEQELNVDQLYEGWLGNLWCRGCTSPPRISVLSGSS